MSTAFRATTPVLRALGRFYRAGLLWWGGGIALGFLLLELAATRGEPDRSLWVYAGTPVRWILLVLGILTVPSLFRVLVAHGATRRTIGLAGAAGIGLLAAATGCYMVAGFLVERALYAAAGVPAVLREPHLFGSTGQVHLIFVEYALVAGAYLTTGWLVGVGYVRFGWLGGTLALPLALLPISAVELLLGLDQGLLGPGANPTIPAPAPGLAVPLAVAGLALALLAGGWLLRPIPVRPKQS